MAILRYDQPVVFGNNVGDEWLGGHSADYLELAAAGLFVPGEKRIVDPAFKGTAPSQGARRTSSAASP